MIYFITACFNRCNFTLRSLRQLNDQATALGVEYKFIVVDDNSTDGTVGDLEGLDFPICVLRTSGNYFWARAMR